MIRLSISTPRSKKLEENLAYIGYPHHCSHVGPIIRNEHEYRRDTLENRQKLLKNMVSFFRHIDVKEKTVYIEKKQVIDSVDAAGRLAKGISAFIRTHLAFFQEFDNVKVYYDNGQIEVSKILSSVFNALLDHVEFRKVFPSDYRLFQVADLVCTLQLPHGGPVPPKEKELKLIEEEHKPRSHTLRGFLLRIN